MDARALFGRLVAPGMSAPDTRRRALFGELSTGMREVADLFVAARLLVADRDPATREPTVEVAHEALLTRWSRLVDWVEEDRRWLTQLQHLSTAARAWDDGGRPEAELYRGSRLEAAIEALDIDGRVTTDVERDFVEAGRHARDAEIRSAHRTGRRLRRLLLATAAALVLALVAGAVAVVQRGQADENAAEAELQAERAETAAAEVQIEALVGRAESLRQTQRDTAALLAVEAYRLADTPRTRSALLATFTDQPTFYDAHHLSGSVGGGGIVMPDGESAYVVDDKGRLRPYGLETGSLSDPFPAIGDMTAGNSVLAASADGRWLAQAWRADLRDGPTTVGVFDTSTGSLRFPPIAVDGAVWSAVFTPDAVELALAIDEGARLLVVDSATGVALGSAAGVIVPELPGETGLEPQAGGVGPTPRPPALALAGDELLLGAADGTLRVFDSATFELRRSIALGPDTLASIRPLDDGTVLTAGRRGVTRVDPGADEVLWQHDQGLSDIGDGASGATCAHLAVIEQQDTFYCANAYGRLAEHDLSSGYAIRVLDGQNGNSGSLWLASDGTELVSFGDNEAVVSRWRLDGSGPITRLVAPGFRGSSFNPSGDRLLVGQGRPFDGLPSQVIDVETGDVLRSLGGLLNTDWLDDDTVIGAFINSDGEVETAHIDLPDGELVADGFIVDPIPDGAGLSTGKERMLVLYSNGTDATLNQYDPRHQAPRSLDLRRRLVRAVDQSQRRSHRRRHRARRRDLRRVHGRTRRHHRRQRPTGRVPHRRRPIVRRLTRRRAHPVRPRHASNRSARSGAAAASSPTWPAPPTGRSSSPTAATTASSSTTSPAACASAHRSASPTTSPTGSDCRSMAAGWRSAVRRPTDQHATKIWDLDPEHWASAACRVAGRNLTREEWASNIGTLAPYRATCSDLPTEA